MTNILSIPGVKVSQKDYHQIIIRGNGLEKFKNTIEEKTSIKPPSKNLEVKYDLNYLFAKNSFDQWSLILTEKKDHHQILNLVSSINTNENMLASDYSYGQVYFEIEGIFGYCISSKWIDRIDVNVLFNRICLFGITKW